MNVITKEVLKEAFGSTPVEFKRELTNYVETEYSSFIDFIEELDELIKNNVIEYEVYKKDNKLVCYVQDNNNSEKKIIVSLKSSDFKQDNEDGLAYFITNVFHDYLPDDFVVFKGIWDGGNAGVKTVPKFRDEDERGQITRSPEPESPGRPYILPGLELEDNSDIVNKDDKIRKVKGEDGELKLPFLHEPLLKR